jgi:hypothetical protein
VKAELDEKFYEEASFKPKLIAKNYSKRDLGRHEERLIHAAAIRDEKIERKRFELDQALVEEC